MSTLHQVPHQDSGPGGAHSRHVLLGEERTRSSIPLHAWLREILLEYPEVLKAVASVSSQYSWTDGQTAAAIAESNEKEIEEHGR